MDRRQLLGYLGSTIVLATASAPLIGYSMSLKRNIKSFGKTYAYLQDPALRTHETNDALLTIENAEFSGVDFKGLTWRNIRFVNCDFAGAYETKLDRLEKSSFEGCRFAGIHNFGDMIDVTLRRCTAGGESYLMGYSDSKRLVFEECSFIGSSPERNHWGAIGGYGEAEFIRCTIKWFAIMGHGKLIIRDSTCESVASRHDPRQVGGVYAPVLIEKCKLSGLFDMSATKLESLTIRDSQIDNLDLGTNVTIKNYVLLERIQAECLLIAPKRGAGSFTLRDSRVTGREDESIRVSAGSFKRVLIENVEFSDDIRRRAIIGGGFRPDDKEPQPVLTESVTFRNVKARVLRSGRLNTDELQVIGCTFTHAEFQESRIGRIEMRGNIISNSLNFTNTQAREQKIDLRAGGGLTGRADKLGGSNIRLQPR